MARKRVQVSVMMDKDIHFKLMITALYQRMFQGNKHASASEIVNQALVEYINEHNDEIENALSEMKKRGWKV